MELRAAGSALDTHQAEAIETMRVQISQDDLSRAVSQGTVSEEQARALWTLLLEHSTAAAASAQVNNEDGRAKFDFVHLAYYAGAVLVIFALAWALGISWEQYGPWGILLITGTYALAFVLAGHHLWYKQNLRTPGGLLVTIAVCLTPIICYAIERITNVWPQGDPGAYTGFHFWVKGSWLLMEVATVIASGIALKYFRFPFLTAPAAFALWYMSMDYTPLLFGEHDWQARFLVSQVFGLLTMLSGYALDFRRKDYRDFGFWLYLFGTFSFFGGLAGMNKFGEVGELLAFLVYVAMMFSSVVLRRKVLLVFGSLGVAGYLSHLAWSVFHDALLFPVALTGIGIAIIAGGVSLQRNREKLETAIQDAVPDSLRKFLPV